MLDFLKNGEGELLGLFFRDVEREYYLSEIGKSLNKPASYYQRYLDRFVEDGILLDERKGNLRFFKLNKDFTLYDEIKTIISKTIGIEAKLKNLVDSLAEVECAFIFGSIAKNKENVNSDIDLMLIGSVIDPNKLTGEINNLEIELCREIDYHIYSAKEVRAKLKEKNNFFINIFGSPIIKLKGNPNEYSESAKR